MCGIFGFRISNNHINEKTVRSLTKKLFLLSESRGKEASGISLISGGEILVQKSPLPASVFLQEKEYNDLLSKFFSSNDEKSNEKSYFIIGHSRLVTNGNQQVNSNNQPVISSDMVAIHNGIITNVDDLWSSNPAFKQETQLDTEIFLKILGNAINAGESLQNALAHTYSQIEGVASIAIQLAKNNCFLLSTNNGSVYYLESKEPGIFIFASEKFILQGILNKFPLFNACQPIQQLKPGNAVLLNFYDSPIHHFSFDFPSSVPFPIWLHEPVRSMPIIDVSKSDWGNSDNEIIPEERRYILPDHFIDLYPSIAKSVEGLQRCSRCILPETMPFIEFDEAGVCNYCRTEELHQPLGMDALMDAVAPYRKSNGDPDCLVTFSGGRDSSYGVHFIRNELKMNPVTYTYDWGMITDLGRRNQMRMCGKLGVENILVSADIAKKRRNIRLNIAAWLRQPDLGTVPLFMAGDKQYFYYANQVGRQTGCKIIVLCENLLETTRFKTGFCGISPHFGSPHTYSLSLGDKFRLLGYYGKKFATNPSYINASLIDTLTAYVSYYFISHNYLNLYDYIQWDEQIINETLKQYNWETSPDTTSTWRIGDGTAAFYNFIYYMMAGFTENDTFRSNQIRAGFITREQALAMVNEENVPRYNSIQWYCDIIGLDFESTIKTINKAPRLFNFE